jgi:hypothetical protein
MLGGGLLGGEIRDEVEGAKFDKEELLFYTPPLQHGFKKEMMHLMIMTVPHAT